jgi:hypothetical protein
MDMTDVSAFRASDRLRQPHPAAGAAALAHAGGERETAAPPQFPVRHFQTEIEGASALVAVMVGQPCELRDLEQLANLAAGTLSASGHPLRIFVHQPPGSPGVSAWGRWHEVAFERVEPVYRPQRAWARLLGIAPVPVRFCLHGPCWRAIREPVRVELEAALRRQRGAARLH